MRRRCSIALILALVVSTGVPRVAVAQSAAPSSRPGSQDYVFPPGTGLLFFYVHRERAAEFEAIIARVTKGLDASTDPIRHEQAASWQTFRSLESGTENSVYLMLFNPAVAGADYDPVKMLSELAPAETPSLYEQLKASVIRVERMALTRLR
jgi:hypothetical protein